MKFFLPLSSDLKNEYALSLMRVSIAISRLITKPKNDRTGINKSTIRFFIFKSYNGNTIIKQSEIKVVNKIF
ncbi:hypothetical protein D3C87_1850030 [compost metagenome]